MPIVYTGNHTDMAIKGEGFFVVGSFDGSNVYYTRNGNFEVNAERYLVTKNGYYVLNEKNKPIVFNCTNTLREVAVVSFEILENLVRFDGGFYRVPKEAKRTHLPISTIVDNALEEEEFDLAKNFAGLLTEQKKIQNEKIGHLEYIKDVTFHKRMKFVCQLPFFYSKRILFVFPLLTMLELNHNANFPKKQQRSKKEIVHETFQDILETSYADLYRKMFFVRKNPNDSAWNTYNLYDEQSNVFRRNGWL